MEYFNVLCGHIAARLFPDTKVAARFTVPAFYPGLYAPEGYAEQVVLTYSSGGIGRAPGLPHPLRGVRSAAAPKRIYI